MGFINQGIDWLWTQGGGVLWPALTFLVVLTPIVFIHELGHFLAARWCGVKVKAFSIGFGKEIFAFNDRHGTRWRFAWIPLGGYVRFMDDENAASAPSREALERMTPAEREGAFQTKPLAARAFIVAAGPLANFLLAIGIFTLMFTFIGELVTPPRVGALEPDGPAARAGFARNDLIVSIDGQEVGSYTDVERLVTLNANRELTFSIDRAGETIERRATPVWREVADPSGRKVSRPTIGIEPPPMPARVGGLVAGGPAAGAGFQPGDLIVSIDGKPVNSFADMQTVVKESANRELAFEVDRGGTPVRLRATPAEREVADKSGAKIKQGIIGIKGIQEGEYRRYGPVEALGQAVNRTYTIIADNLSALYQIATRRMPADQLRGPLGIAEMSAQVASWGLVPLISFVGFISVAIGFFNLLPVPVLDGGHLLFYAIEAVRREPLSERTQEIGFRIGLTLVLLLFVFVMGVDAKRWFGLG